MKCIIVTCTRTKNSSLPFASLRAISCRSIVDGNGAKLPRALQFEFPTCPEPQRLTQRLTQKLTLNPANGPPPLGLAPRQLC